MPDTPAPKRQKTDPEDGATTDVAADQQQQQEDNGDDTTMSDPAPLTPADLAGSFPLQVQKLSDKAQLPKRGSALAAGYDLFSSEAGVIPAKGKAIIATGISIALPPGTYGRVAPRSGLAVKYSIDTGAGVVDADYRGELKVILFNFSDADYEVKEGDRIAQLIVERIYTPEIVEVKELASTDRGVTGFGSTGR